MGYELKNIKTFLGREGHGLNAVICRDGKPVAFVLDDANGGMIEIDFTNPGQTAASYEANKRTARQEEELALEFAANWFKTSPDAAYAREQSEKIKAEFSNAHDTPRDCLESWINTTVDMAAQAKALARHKKTKVLFRLPEDGRDSMRTVAHHGDPAKARAWVTNKYPNATFID
jgi:hypothetical protein